MLALQVDNPQLEVFLEKLLPNGKISTAKDFLDLAEALKLQQQVQHELAESIQQAEKGELIAIEEAFEEVERYLLNEFEHAQN